MIGRRAFLKMVPSAGAAATMINPAELLASAEKIPVVETMDYFHGDAAVGVATDPMGKAEQALWAKRHKAMNLLRKQYDREFRRGENMPTHIATKKSWSPAFKDVVARQEENQLTELIEKMEGDQNFTDKIVALLGL